MFEELNQKMSYYIIQSVTSLSKSTGKYEVLLFDSFFEMNRQNFTIKNLNDRR